jgi:hypothetical protein
MNGIQYTIKRSTGKPTFGTVQRQDFEIWYDRDGFWLNLEDAVMDNLSALPTHLVSCIKYVPDELPDNALGDTMILVLGAPGHNIAASVIRVVRDEYNLLTSEVEAYRHEAVTRRNTLEEREWFIQATKDLNDE